jgi:hypothetical protein
VTDKKSPKLIKSQNIAILLAWQNPQLLKVFGLVDFIGAKLFINNRAKLRPHAHDGDFPHIERIDNTKHITLPRPRDGW